MLSLCALLLQGGGRGLLHVDTMMTHTQHPRWAGVCVCGNMSHGESVGESTVGLKRLEKLAHP